MLTPGGPDAREDDRGGSAKETAKIRRHFGSRRWANVVAPGMFWPSIDRALGNAQPVFVRTGCLVLAMLLGLLDHWTGFELSFSIFYLTPVAIATWYTGLRAGALLSLVSATIWLAADITSGNTYSHPLIGVWNAVVRLGYFVIIANLLSAVKGKLLLQEQIARTDSLTGLANARSFHERLEAELLRMRRYRHPFTVAYMDLDGFKTVNDREGHETGDEVLRRVAQTLREHTRQSDVAARLGGDEFVALFPETGSVSAREAVQNVRGHLVDAMRKGNWPVTFSIGVVTFEVPMNTVRETVKLADDLMYAAKQDGKNTIRHAVWKGSVIASNTIHGIGTAASPRGDSG